VKTPSLRTSPSFILMLSLSYTDLGIGLSIQPTFCFLLLSNLDFSFNKNLISIVMQKLGVPLAFASIITICCMSIDRFLAIKLFARYKSVVTPKRATTLVHAVWLFSAVFSGLTMVPQVKELIAKVVIVLVSLLAIICIVLMVWTSYSIKMQIKRIQDLKEEDERTVNVVKYQRSVKTLHYIIIPFALCYLPLFVVRVLAILDIFDKTHLWIYAALTLCFLNSSINPCIYCTRIKDIRKAVLLIIRPS